MVELVLADSVTIGLYFLLVVAVGLWSTCRPNKGSAVGYFLAGKTMTWFPIGASLYATNIGAPIFIGLAGTAAASGFAVVIYEWHAVYILIALGWFFVPVYVSSGSYTMPEYLGKRFGGSRIRIFFSVKCIFLFIICNITAEVYSGTIFLEHVLGWNTFLCVAVIIAITAVYTVAGGLLSVLYTDTLQAVILLCGAVALAGLAIDRVGGMDGVYQKYPTAAANYTLHNQSFYACGMPRDDAFHILRDPVTGDIPWPGALVGLTLLGLFAWCEDQIIVQRCLSAKNLSHAKGGSLMAAMLKLLGFPLFIIPGMISRILYPDEIACANPEACWDFCKNEAGCSNLAYPILVMRILPPGIRGVMIAALLAALMSSLTSIINSASSIVTMDIWTKFRKQAKETELMIVGRVTVVVLLLLSILWLPILKKSQGGLMWFYLQSVRAYFVVPWCMMFLLGLLWKRMTEQAAFWGVLIGLVVGAIRMIMDYAVPAPLCGSGEPDKRLPLVTSVDFLHFAIILAVITTVTMVVISLFTTPRTEKQLHKVTWWTRHDVLDPELSDCELEDDSDEGVREKLNPNLQEMTLAQEEDPPTYRKRVRDWLCGAPTDPLDRLTAGERAAIRKRLTSIKENKKLKRILNTIAIILSVATFGLLIHYR